MLGLLIGAAILGSIISAMEGDFPGWISFSMDGRMAYSSTGEIIDVKTKKVVATLQDEAGRQVQSEKLLDLIRLWTGGGEGISLQ